MCAIVTIVIYERPHSWTAVHLVVLRYKPYMDNKTKDHEKKSVYHSDNTAPRTDTQSERMSQEKETDVPSTENKK